MSKVFHCRLLRCLGEKIMKKTISILRRKEVEARVKLSRSTIYLLMQEGLFPMPISLGARAVGWLEHEIDDWLNSRIEMRDNGRQAF